MMTDPATPVSDRIAISVDAASPSSFLRTDGIDGFYQAPLRGYGRDIGWMSGRAVVLHDVVSLHAPAGGTLKPIARQQADTLLHPAYLERHENLVRERLYVIRGDRRILLQLSSHEPLMLGAMLLGPWPTGLMRLTQDAQGLYISPTPGLAEEAQRQGRAIRTVAVRPVIMKGLRCTLHLARTLSGPL